MSLRLPGWFPIVKNNLCHRTGAKALRNIFNTGAILPNDGTFPDTYPQSNSSFARIHNLVSLFDFEKQTNDECLKQVHNWYRFFFDHLPVTIVILLDRKILSASLIANEKAVEITKGTFDPIFIPNFEAFYPQPVPCKSFTGYLIICGVYEKIYEYIPTRGAFGEIFEKIDDFVKKYKDIYMDPLNKLEKESATTSSAGGMRMAPGRSRGTTSAEGR
jgi:hypothetical protein